MTSFRVGLSGRDRDTRSALGILDIPTPTGQPKQLVLPTDRDQDITVRLEDDEPSWLRPTVGRFAELLHLPDNWDSYGGRRVEPRSVVFALDLLSGTMLSATPAPSVVPTSDGGVQLEWHMRGIDIEIGVTAKGHVTAAYEAAAGGAGWEADEDLILERLAGALAELTERG